MTEYLRLPPFGKLLLAYQEEKLSLQFPIYIFVGKNAKADTIAHKKTLGIGSYLPYGEDYTRYKWPIIGQKLIVFDSGFNSAIKLKQMCAYFLATYKPHSIFLYSDNFPFQLFKQGN